MRVRRLLDEPTSRPGLAALNKTRHRLGTAARYAV